MMKNKILKSIFCLLWGLFAMTSLQAQPQDCDCDFELDPVCVLMDNGDVIPFPNACFAECEGYSEDSYVDCEGGVDPNPNDCDCDFEFDPVCVELDNGDVLTFPSACFAACEGYEADSYVDCEGGVDPNPNDCDCDFEFDPVCVDLGDGEIIPFPNACFAACEGYEEDSYVDCEGGVDPNPNDCDCDFEFDPVCVELDNGDVLTFPSACFAACEGYEEDSYVDCEGGVDPNPNDCDCDFEFEPVCVTLEDGSILPFPNACYAECEGYDNYEVCEDIEPEPNDCDCEVNPDDEWVCVLTAGDLICPFPNECLALCAGYTVDDIVECDSINIEPNPDGCDCGFELDPVCVTLEDGSILTFPSACYAECAGFNDYEDCEGQVEPNPNDCDCEINSFEEWVCVDLGDGEIIPFPNACFAACEGFEAGDLVDCNGGIDPNPNDCDCEINPDEEWVCVLTAGDLICPFPNECIAICAGYTADDIVDCEDIDINPNPDPNDCDCDFEFDPVCVTLDDGSILTFPSACFAECAGFDNYEDCENVDPNPNDCVCDEVFDPVCAEVDGEIYTFPNACYAACEGFEAEDLFACDDNPGGCGCDFEGDEVCVEIEEGLVLPFPNACWAECAGFTADDFVDCEGFNPNFPDGLIEFVEIIIGWEMEGNEDESGLVELDPVFGQSNGNAATAQPWSVYPNPMTSGILNLQIDVEEASTAVIRVQGLSGSLVYQENRKLQGGSETIVLNLDQLPAGVYILQVQTDKENRSLKFVK